MNDTAYLLYHWTGWDELPSDTIICVDKDEALEMFMTLVEEEMYITFAYMTQDELEGRDWVDMAKWLTYENGTLWNVMEVPIIYGDSCC